MKACARMYRVYEDGTRVPVESSMVGRSPMAECDESTKIIVELWHGTCLDSVVEVSLRPAGSGPYIPLVRLLDKKENRAGGPPEAV